MPSPRSIIAASVVIILGSVSTVYSQAASDVAGCYSTYGETQILGPAIYQTQGLCLGNCQKINKAVWAVTKGSTCFCGDAVPTSGKVDDSQCDVICQGFNQSCGGQTEWLFGYTGVLPPDIATPSSDSSSSTSTSTSTGSKPSSTSKTSIAVQTTVVSQSPAVVTAASEQSSSTSAAAAKSSSTSKAGIAAGVVVGVIAIIAIGVGAFLVVRRNRRQRAEEEYRAAVAAKEFTASIRKPAPDSRLDPVMLQHRRLSDGSIADNQDFSRRILKVTNPDNS